jgi:hypothetical protein
MTDEYSKFDEEGIPTHAWVKAGDKDKKGKGKGKDKKDEAKADGAKADEAGAAAQDGPQEKELNDQQRNKLKKEW